MSEKYFYKTPWTTMKTFSKPIPPESEMSPRVKEGHF